MMKRIAILGTLFAAVLAFSGSAAPLASARCVKTAAANTGAWKEGCQEEEVNGNWIRTEGLGKKVGQNLYCAKVVKAGSGRWEDVDCTDLGGNKEFLLFRLALVVNGTALANNSTVALANTAAVDESTAFSVPSLGLRLTCSGSTLDSQKAYIQGEGSGGTESLTFLGCSEISPSTCSIETSISTEPLVASIEPAETGLLDQIRFAPRTGKSFADIAFKGTCSFSGEQPIDGQVVVDSRTGQKETTVHGLEGLGTTENNSLEILKDKGYLVGGKALLKLASGLPWAFAAVEES